MIQIRAAIDADAEIIGDILCSSIRELCDLDHKDDPKRIADWTANKTPEQIRLWIADPQTALIVADLDGQPAGVGSYSSNGQIVLNYVSPRHRFRGVSRALLAHMEQAIAIQGHKTGKLTSTQTAHGFYRKSGWIDVPATVSSFSMRGHAMEKALCYDERRTM